jgi:AcrR family transcriptional regulator
VGRRPDPERRTELLAAVTAYLERNGLAGLSLRPLGAAVGVSPRTLLYHFGSKEKLLAEALSSSAALQSAVAEFTDSERPLFDRIRQLWTRTAEPDARPYLSLFFEVYAAALRDPARYAAFLDTVVDRWLRLLVPLLQAEGLRPADARSTATELLALHHGCTLDLLATHDRRRVTAAYLARIAELEARTRAGAGDK